MSGRSAVVAVAVGLVCIGAIAAVGTVQAQTTGGDDADPGTQTGGTPGAGSADDYPHELVAEGRRLYEVGCSSCHGLDGRGTEQGPSLVGAGAASAHFYLSTGRMPLDRAGGQARRKDPAYAPDEIRALTAYVATLGDGPPIPRIEPATGDLSLGFQLYAVNCASCHNSAASGGALGQAVFAPGLRQSTPTQLAEAIRIGPGAMPVFGRETLTDHQVASIIRYIEHLERVEDRGGLPLGRVGPMPEGFVAWIVGLGLMLLAAFWIGTRE